MLFWYAFLDPFYTWDRLNPWLSIELSHKKTKIMRLVPNLYRIDRSHLYTTIV